jgi:hypothetical protein
MYGPFKTKKGKKNGSRIANQSRKGTPENKIKHKLKNLSL